jgi:hypothetical protein
MRPNANRLLFPAAILLLVLAIQHASAADEDYVTLASRYCNEIKPDAKCNWVDGEEWKALNLDVFMEGTAVGGWSGPPATISPYSSMFQYFPSFMSLSCTGTVKVETVFMLSDYDTATYGPGDGGGAGLVCGSSGQKKIRCSLGTGPTPSISNATTECVTCSDNDGDCPFEANTWYSDTLYQDIGYQCPPSKDAYPSEADIYVNPGQSLYVASFTVEEVNQLD